MATFGITLGINVKYGPLRGRSLAKPMLRERCWLSELWIWEEASYHNIA